MNDGIYVEPFAVKDGVRYNAKILDMKEMTTILANSLAEGIAKLWEEMKPAEEPEPKCQHVWKHDYSTYDYERMCTIEVYRCARCGEHMTQDEPYERRI